MEELFTLVPNKNVTIKDLSQPIPYDEKNTHKLVKIVPVKDEDQLCFSWCLPYCEKAFKTKPLDYINSLIGHEGPNSLLSYLVK